MANVIVTIREYTVKAPLALGLIVENTSWFNKKKEPQTVNLKENDVVYRINKSFYLRQNNYEYVLLDVKEDFIRNNPKIFELKEVAKEEGKK